MRNQSNKRKLLQKRVFIWSLVIIVALLLFFCNQKLNENGETAPVQKSNYSPPST